MHWIKCVSTATRGKKRECLSGSIAYLTQNQLPDYPPITLPNTIYVGCGGIELAILMPWS
ncbi:hypothetical protein PILCRDRAFT_199139 [Piloderma croceum F 1598]|uniref:Uncharacterized protein n=1 Tax=Piloderma croceum (strain F 1598) TaxID=765440 RepID=A0A0C3G0V0_PILCF|nr:hypothetical protein PILCRDRAFT_199139 [Piloderma croceum F 1598]